MSVQIKITKTTHSKLNEVDFNNIPFGKTFTDHMFEADYINGEWQNAQIKPLTEIPVHPGNMAWHYGQAIFEGMKATRDEAGNALLFRPREHAIRFNKSAERLSMPHVPEDLFLDAIHTLVDLEKAWIPPQTGSAMYIRPFMISFDHTIGVKPSDTYKFMVFVLPVGPYYSQPVKLMAFPEYVRAVVGGVGEVKAAGNYAASLFPAAMAKKEGYDQVMWLDGIHHKYIQEVGTMNIFFVIGDDIITPNLDGAILKGITRDSAIKILKSKGHNVIEKPISIDEIIEASNSGRLKEVFGTGTAAVVAQVATIKYNDVIMNLDTSHVPVSTMVKDTINGLRNRTVEDTFGWIVPAKGV